MGDPEVRPLTQNVNRLEDDTGACHSRRRCVPSGRAHRETGHAIGPIVPSVVRAPAVCGAVRSPAPHHRARVFRAGEFPSGQRGQTVNLMAQPSQVRILLPPPASLCGPFRVRLLQGGPVRAAARSTADDSVAVGGKPPQVPRISPRSARRRRPARPTLRV